MSGVKKSNSNITLEDYIKKEEIFESPNKLNKKMKFNLEEIIRNTDSKTLFYDAFNNPQILIPIMSPPYEELEKRLDKIKDDDSKIATNKGILYSIVTQNIQKAKKSFENALIIDNKNYWALIEFANLNYKFLNSYSYAEFLLEKAIKINENEARGLVYNAELLGNFKKTPIKAVDFIQSRIESVDDKFLIYTALGYIKDNFLKDDNKNDSEIKDLFFKSLEINDSYIMTHINLINNYILRDINFDSPIKHLEKISKINPYSSYVWISHGLLCQNKLVFQENDLTKKEKEKLINEGIDFYKKALSFKKDEYLIYNNLAGLLKIKDRNQMFESYYKSIKKNPDYNLSRMYLSKELLHEGNIIDAYKELINFSINSRNNIYNNQFLEIYNNIRNSIENINNLNDILISKIKEDNVDVITKLEYLLIKNYNTKKEKELIIDSIKNQSFINSLEEDSLYNSGNSIVTILSSPIIRNSLFIKKNNDKDKIEDEYYTNKWIYQLTTDIDDNIVSDPIDIFDFYSNWYLITKKEKSNLKDFLPKESISREEYIVQSIQNLARIHTSTYLNLNKKDFFTIENKNIQLKSFNYLNSVNRRFFSRTNNKIKENLLPKYMSILKNQEDIDEEYNSKMNFFLHTDAYEHNVLGNGIWVDWEDRGDGRLGNILYDISAFLSFEELDKKRYDYLDIYLDSINNDLKYELIKKLGLSRNIFNYIIKRKDTMSEDKNKIRESFNFNLFHHSLCSIASMKNLDKVKKSIFYIKQTEKLSKPYKDFYNSFREIKDLLYPCF